MSFSAILPNLTKDGSNPFENLSEKLNQNRDEFFDGFLMGDLGLGEKQIRLVEEAEADTLRASQTKTDFFVVNLDSEIHGIFTDSADMLNINMIKLSASQDRIRLFTEREISPRILFCSFLSAIFSTNHVCNVLWLNKGFLLL